MLSALTDKPVMVIDERHKLELSEMMRHLIIKPAGHQLVCFNVLIKCIMGSEKNILSFKFFWTFVF